MTSHEYKAPCFTKNAMAVLEKRYLRKDKDGQVIETPTDMFRRVAEAIADAERKFDPNADTSELGRAVLRCHGRTRVPAQLPHADERRPGTGPAFRLLRSARRGFDGRDLRCGQVHGPDPQIRRRHRLLLFPAPPQERRRPVHHRNLQRPDLLHAGLRHRYGDDQAGGHAAGRQHGTLAGGPSGHHGFHPLQELTRGSSTTSTSPWGSPTHSWRLWRGTSPIRLSIPGRKVTAAHSRPKEVFDLIVRQAWENGEPGIIFLDRMNRDNPTPHAGHDRIDQPLR